MIQEVKKNKKRAYNKGITLIALIITIIILLILAGITIAMLTGENGIITKALKAKEDTMREAAREKIEMALLEYKINTQENNKNTITLKEVIEKIEGLQSKEPEECDSFPIIVVVDGFKFEIDEDLNVTYVGKEGNLEVPTIKIGSYEQTQNVDELALEVEAQIKDEKGIQKIQLIKIEDQQESVVKTITIEGREKKVNRTLMIYVNGKYKIRAFGNNGTQGESEEFQINNVNENNNILGTIKAGDISNGNINLIVTGSTNKAGIKKIEIYVDGQKSKEYEYDGSSKTISTEEDAYTVENIEFYGAQKQCYAKVITEIGEVESEKIQIENKSDIKTLKDLQNFSAQVNGGNNFSGKVIKQVADIQITGNLAQIGDENRKFNGTYDGGEHAIRNISISSNKDYVGLFGYNEGTIKNLVTGGNVTKNSGSTVNLYVYAGGIVAYNKGRIDNCINNINVTGNEELGLLDLGGICGGVDETSNSYIENCINNGSININAKNAGSEIGGICGGSFGGSIKSSENRGSIIRTSSNNIWTNTGGIIGGTNGIIEGCRNTGTINTTETNGKTNLQQIYEEYFVGGIVGYTTNTVQNCENSNNITAKLSEMPKRLCIGGIAGYSTGYLGTSNNSGEINQELKNTTNREDNVGVFQGGIVGWKEGNTLENCKNTGKITGSVTNVTTMWTGGILGGTWAKTNISKCSNVGLIESTATLIPQYYNRELDYEYLNTGGVAGCLYNNGSSLNQCFNTGNIKADLTCGIGKFISGGGIVGECFGSVEDCYNIGSLEANNRDTSSSITIGGIIGFVSSGGTLKNSYNTSFNIFRSSSSNYKKPYEEFKGLVVGWNDGSISNCYYLSSSNNGTYYATAGINGGTNTGTTAKTSSQLQGLASTLGNTYWASASTINSGYPYLKNNRP